MLKFLKNGIICLFDSLSTKTETTKTPERENPAPALLLSQTLRGVVAGDCLDLEIFLQAVFAPLAAVAGLLVAAERRGAVVRHALQVDVPCADPAADLPGGLHGAGGDVTSEPTRRVAADPDRAHRRLAAQNGEHRAQ